ncbi:hemagglutinin repeat-containing protein, partial [Ciceribacter sp. RN22]|uniref:two-partner secretion domain-containing protein n=1 Tax=Ciceribacter sp. RN22 TaxID=2954932 RepID=UPI0020935221
MSSKIVHRSVASLLSAVLALHPALVQAQAITPDGGAASANRPTVGTAPNGVPLVDIVTPNGRGLSHNKYGAYNVGTPGLILNNSNAETGISKLGGVTPGNPNLRNSGPATVILNEVTSGGRSALLGPTEVFGGRADVIVANPNGITCDGCGFINTPRATLTTGTPDIDATGRLLGFTVRGGDVTFGTKGGNFAGGEGAVDLFDIVSRTVRIDGPVNGKDLRITTGRNRFDYATGEATGLAGADDASEFAIDGSALGAMQADRIRIAVTDKGAGVRMRNDMVANAGALTLSADGRISLGNASGRDGVDIRSKSRQVEAKKITSKSRVTVKAASGVTLHTVAADGDVLIATGGLVSVAGELASLGNMELTASGAIAAGQVSAGRDAVMQAGAGITAGQVLADGAIRLSASSGNIALSGMAKTGGALQITATSGAINAASLVSFNNMTLTAGREIGIVGDLLAGGKLVASAGSLKAASVVSGVDFAATGASPSGTIVLKTGGDMRLTAGAGTIEVGSILTSGDLAARAGLLVASGITGHSGILIAGDTRVAGQVLGAGDVTISGAGIHAGAIVSGVDLAATAASPTGAILLAGTGDMRLAATAGDVAAGSLLSAGDMAVTAAGNITTSAVSHGTMDVDARGAITLSGQSLASGDVRLAGSSIKTESLVSGVDFAATERAGGPFVLRTDAGSMSLTASGLVEAATLLSAGRLDVLSNSFRAGNATSHAEAAIVGDTVVTGQLLSASDLSVTGSTISAGLAAAGVDLAALENGSVALGKPARTLVLTASAGDIGIADLLSSGDAKLNAAGGVSGNALVHGDLSATAAGAINLAGQSLVGGNALLNANAITLGTLVSGVDFAATEHSGGSLVLTAGAGDMTLLARTGSILADQLVSGGDLKARALQDIGYDSLRSFAGVDLRADQGTISLDRDTVAKGDIALSLQHLDLSNNRGKLATAGTLTVDAGSADLSGSTLTFGGVSLNLSGLADVSAANIRAVTADGGTGDIAISAQTITTTPATALLAANDLTLTLASLSNTGQLAAGNDLTVNVSGNLTNTPTGLVYAGNDGRLLVEGDLFNDQGAILVGNDLTIAADADGARNRSVTNVSGLIKAGRDAFITTENLTNKRLFVPGLKEVVVLTGTAGEFRLNPDVADEPFMQLYQGWNDDTSRDYIFPDLPRQLWEDYQDRLWSRTVLADGSSYHAWTWISAQGPTGSTTIRNWIADRVPRDADGNITLDPDNPSKYFVVVEQGKPHDTSTTYSRDEAAYIGQTVTQEVFDGELAPEALIHTGRNLMIDATVLNNSSSSIEAEGNAALKGETLNNEGVMATRTTTLECHAQGACEAYDAKGRRNPSKDMANGTSVLGNVEAVSLASANIKAAGNLDISGFATVNNTSAAGSIAGHAVLAPSTDPADPTAALAGLTAGGALFTPNAALGGLLAGAGVSGAGTGLQPGALPLASADMLAALATSVPKPGSGGFGGTVPGQVFLYETRAEFLDVGRFYGSGYFIDRIGYKPEREVPFLGDAYFENELVDVQLRQLAGQGLGKGSFVPGSDAIEQMKVLLDRGIEFARAHGLAIGEQLSPELAASLTGTLVWYEKRMVAGIEVLVPTVYVADADRATLTASGALISGGSLTMNVGAVDNSGTIAAKGDLRLAATTIAANGGSFVAGNDLRLDASRTITLTAQSVDIGGASVVNPNAMVDAGGNAVLKAGDTLKLTGAGVEVDGSALLAGRDVTLDAVKVENGGSENATGTRVNAGGNLAVSATNDVTIIGSSASAGGALGVTAENGSVSVVTKDVKRGTDDGYTTTATTTQQMSQLTSGGDMRVGAGRDVLLSGSALGAGGDAAIVAGGDVNITAVANRSSVQFGANSGERIVNAGAEITAGGNVAVSAGGSGAGDLTIIGSSIAAGEAVDLRAAGNVTIAEAIDQETYDLHNKSGNGAHTDSHIAIETASGSAIRGESGVAISAGNDMTVSASTVEAGSADKTADLTIAAGGNIVVSSGKDVLDQDTQSRGHGFLQSNEWSSEVHDEATVASRLGASGSVTLYADKTVAIAGSEVTAGEDIAISGESVAIIGAQEAHDLAIGKETSGLFAGSGDGFFSIWGEEEKEKSGSTVVNAASTITAGGNVSVTARARDIDIVGSGIAAGGDIALSAARDVNVTPGSESAMSQETEKRSGFGISLSSGSGSASIGIGYGSAEDQVTQSSGTNALSTLSAAGDVTITAGNDVNLQAAKVEAGQDIALYALNDINLLSAQDETNYAHRHEEFFAGISLNVQSSLISAGQQLADSASGLGDANGLYSLAPTALAAYKAGTALQQAGDGGSLGSASLTIGFTQQKT